MGRVVVVVGPGAGFGPGEVAAAWNADPEGAAAGMAVVEAAPRGEIFFPGLVELVIVPVAVNVASSAVYDLVKKLAARLHQGDSGEPKVEHPEITSGNGDVIIVIRPDGGPR